MWLLKCLHFWFSMASSCTYLYATYFYFDYFKLSKDQVGLVASITPLISLFAIPAIMYYVDRSKDVSMKSVLMFCTVVGTLCWTMNIYVVPFTNYTIYFLCLIAAVSAMTLSSIGTILDSLTLTMLGDNKEDYGQQRLFASLSWGLSSLMTGYLMDRTKNPFTPIYIFFLSNCVSFGFVCLIKLNNPQNSNSIEEQVRTNDDDDADISNVVINEPDSGNFVLANETDALLNSPSNSELEPTLLQSLRKIRTILFFTTVALLGLVFAIIGSYLFIFMSTTWKASPTVLGMTTPLSVFCELPLFFYSNRLLKYFGTKKLMIGAHLLLLLRFLLYMYLPIILQEQINSHPYINYIVIPIELLHGASFGLYWSSGLEYVQVTAPKRYIQTFIGIYCSLSNNAGGIIGNTIGGVLYEQFGSFYLWGFCFGLTLLSLLLFLISIVS
ncbi:major facilitator superfamily domain-containing protein [Globomyces pollinis-pini]|nr:major facilitator superfamily domain-containing protein [Globomyces pollinis-pini]